jgi:LacI family transcriptional regulator
MSMQRIAQLAGVSTSTVCRVLQADPRVAAKTAETVRQVVEQIGFTHESRRPRGRANRNATGNAIAFLVLGADGSNATPAFEQLLRGVSDAANTNNLSIVLSFVSDPSHIPPRLLARPLAGVLCHGDQPCATKLGRLRALPTVWLMANRHRPQWGDQVMPNNAVIGDMAARHLIRRGHRRLAYLGIGPGGWSMGLRAFAFGKAAEDAGATCRVVEAPPSRLGDFWCADGLASTAALIVERLFDGSPAPTGLFVAEDRLLPVIDRALRARGIHHGRAAGGKTSDNGHSNGNGDEQNHAEGGDAVVEIISCNNEQPYYVEWTTPPARIDIRPEAIGRRGVEQLIWRVGSGVEVAERLRVMVDPVLIEPNVGENGNTSHVTNEAADRPSAEIEIEMPVTSR